MGGKKSFFDGIHNDGFTWKDSVFISVLLFLMMFILGTAIGLPLSTLFESFSNGENSEFVKILGDNFSFLGYWIIAIVYLLIARSDRPILRAIGTEPKGNNIKMLLLGLPLGLGLNALCVAVAAMHGDIQLFFSSFPVIRVLLIFISVFVQSSGEEILCRAVLYQRLRKGYRNPWVAILLNPFIFMLVHAFIPGITIWAIISICLVGIVFSLFVYYFDSLWMAMGMHAAWNFTQNFIFGLPNSGTVYNLSIFKIDTAAAKDSLFYNVEFGVEATLTAVIVFLIATVVIIYIGEKKKLKSTDIWANSVRK